MPLACNFRQMLHSINLARNRSCTWTTPKKQDSSLQAAKTQGIIANPVATFGWTEATETGDMSCKLYAAQFSKAD
jgi:hypothetical protein